MARFERRSSAKPGGRREPRGGPRSSGRNTGKRDTGRRDSERPVRRNSGRFERRSSSRFSGRSSDRQEKTKVTCSSCGAECEVPFKPTSNKPVYCDDCFKKNSGKKSNNYSSNYSSEFAEMNRKLDKIMKVLKIN